jgi:hypothetical protein
MKTLYPLLAALLAAGSAALPAAEPWDSGKPSVTLAELARKADFIALAQVRETDYRRQREIPVSGSAYLSILIPYKGQPEAGIVEIYEKGLHAAACYFPTPTVFEEGRRYLLFLRRDPDRPARYRGLAEGCAIDVLVDSDNRYAVRLPLTGMAVSDRLQGRARTLQFRDPYALVDDASLPPALRNAMQAAGQIVPYEPDATAGDSAAYTPPEQDTRLDRVWRYTQGISLGEFRELLRLD